MHSTKDFFADSAVILIIKPIEVIDPEISDQYFEWAPEQSLARLVIIR